MKPNFASLFLAGLLIGMSIGLLTNHLAVWTGVGAAIGIVMASATRRRNKKSEPQSQGR
jgi:F0F1-type ATP synthase assembly protein I